MRFERSSGVLVHPTSLPGGHGIGDLGAGAYQFVDFLAAAGQRYWQILPLGPNGPGESPYASPSAFAGNPLLISLDTLVADGLLTSSEMGFAPPFPTDRVDFGRVREFKRRRFERAFVGLQSGRGKDLMAELRAYCEREAYWLDDYALFMALKEQNEGRAWPDWGKAARRRAVSAASVGADAVEYHRFVQFLFERQWRALRHYANERDIQIIGDAPIFVSDDSADVWAHPEVFHLDKKGRPTLMAGVPPDFFSASGQLWGNPLYRWDVLEKEKYGWWVDRIRATLRLVDVIRFDHFRGFQAYWEIPAGSATAASGKWVPGPGRRFFDAVREQLGDVPFVLEDLGIITPDVEALRDDLGLPGMKVLQFAFGDTPKNPYLPHNYERNCVVYTGTHDNDTTVGWYENAGTDLQDSVRRYLGTDGSDIAWDLIRTALRSVADIAIIPLQDLFSLGAEARMNLPGTEHGNWSWRCPPDLLAKAPTDRLRELTWLYRRMPIPDEPDVSEPLSDSADEPLPDPVEPTRDARPGGARTG